MSNRFTERAQRVILIAQEEAKRLNHDYVGTEHLLLGSHRPRRRRGRPGHDQLGRRSAPRARRDRKDRRHRRQRHVAGRDPVHSPGQESARVGGGGSPEHGPQLRRHRAPPPRPDPRRRRRGGAGVGEHRRPPRRGPRRSHFSFGRGAAEPRPGPARANAPRHGRQIQIQDPHPGRVWSRPDPDGQGRQARPRDRPRKRDRAGHPNLVAPHQEQPRADRRSRRGEDRHRRRVGPAFGLRRRAGTASRQARHDPGPGRRGGRHQVPRRVRAAPQEHHGGDSTRQEPDHFVHRRVAHRHRRGRGRRGHRRLQHAQALPGARRAPVHRRHDHGRVPQVHRARRRPRAALPADPGRPAVRRGHHQDPQGPQGPLRDPPQGQVRGRGASKPRRNCRTATSRTVSCRTKPSI
jgi:hypothetical protein